MRNPQGVIIVTSESGVRECDTFTCGHCQRVQLVKPGEKPDDLGGLCKICDQLICVSCVATGVCDPFEEKLRRMEASYHARRSYGSDERSL